MLAYVDEAEAELGRLFGAIDDAPPDLAVPTCPGWTIADLTSHVRGAHRWVEATVRRGERVRYRDATEDVTPAQLLATLRAADPDAEVWSFGHDQHVRFWQRRMLHEALVHRIDVELALGRTPEVDPAVGADGIDEFLDNSTVLPWLAKRFTDFDRWGDTIHLHASDGEGEWLIDFAEPGFTWDHAHAKATTAVIGPTTALLMLLYGRTSPDDSQLKVFGDPGLLTSWQLHNKFENSEYRIQRESNGAQRD